MEFEGIFGFRVKHKDLIREVNPDIVYKNLYGEFPIKMPDVL